MCLVAIVALPSHSQFTAVCQIVSGHFTVIKAVHIYDMNKWLSESGLRAAAVRLLAQNPNRL